MESGRALCDLPDTYNGALDMQPYAFAKRRKRHVRALETFPTQFTLKCLDAVAQRRLETLQRLAARVKLRSLHSATKYRI